VVGDDQPDAGDGQAGRLGVAERPVVPLKPGNAGGGKGPQFKTDAARSEGPGDWATYQLRKCSETADGVTRESEGRTGYRFYALYDKISREDILAHAWAQCRSNKGAPGVDGQDFADVEAYGVQRWLGELALALRKETYRPDPIRRVFIPKANGKLRPLGISTLRDRVCMTAAMLVLDPIFEADLPAEQYAYRPGRNAQQAVIEVEETLFRGHPEVVDADLADYFGSIPHAELMLSLARRIVDRRVLHLIKMWLECAVEETDDRGRKTRTTEAKDQRRGIPQGSPISPLLANLYMRRFVLGWKKLGLEQSLGSRIVTYADDLVILCRKGKAEEALSRCARSWAS
jgi:RNA-directed DNA polymerase